MPTDIAAFRARLLDERAAVVAEIATFDLADESARFEASETLFRTAQQKHARDTRRWNLVQEKLSRLDVLDAQIDIVTP